MTLRFIFGEKKLREYFGSNRQLDQNTTKISRLRRSFASVAMHLQTKIANDFFFRNTATINQASYWATKRWFGERILYLKVSKKGLINNLTYLQFSFLDVPMCSVHLKSGPLVLDKVQNARYCILRSWIILWDLRRHRNFSSIVVFHVSLKLQVFTPWMPPLLKSSTRQSIGARGSPNAPKKPSFDLPLIPTAGAIGVL